MPDGKRGRGEGRREERREPSLSLSSSSSPHLLLVSETPSTILIMDACGGGRESGGRGKSEGEDEEGRRRGRSCGSPRASCNLPFSSMMRRSLSLSLSLLHPGPPVISGHWREEYRYGMRARGGCVCVCVWMRVLRLRRSSRNLWHRLGMHYGLKGLGRGGGGGGGGGGGEGGGGGGGGGDQSSAS